MCELLYMSLYMKYQCVTVQYKFEFHTIFKGGVGSKILKQENPSFFNIVLSCFWVVYCFGDMLQPTLSRGLVGVGLCQTIL